MSTGTVKWFNTTKGYGFITPDDGGKDVFIHKSALQPGQSSSITEGQRVEFEVATGNKGPEGTNVRAI
ncbi:MAG: cold-shock protein [Actinobacteria bacterium]|jgi:CspA family cold shock protein|nr:cold-shock protein [Actinomycetota bacterium]MCL6104776.1 cold-shock protein [Actinomycetota bacterium]